MPLRHGIDERQAECENERQRGDRPVQHCGRREVRLPVDLVGVALLERMRRKHTERDDRKHANDRLDQRRRAVVDWRQQA